MAAYEELELLHGQSAIFATSSDIDEMGERLVDGAVEGLEADGGFQRVSYRYAERKAVACDVAGCEQQQGLDDDAQVDADAAPGTPSNRRMFAEVPPPGYPDGSTVDAAGSLWNAEFNGWRLVRYTPAGIVDRVVPMIEEAESYLNKTSH